jgi:hypothetical protein
MYSQIKFALLVLVSVFASACATQAPPYQFSPEESTANILRGGMADLCLNGKMYTLSAAADDGSVKIPSGKRVSLANFMRFDSGNFIYTCKPAISFLPKSNATYYLHNYIRDNKCYMEVVKDDKSTEIGLAFEPSIGPRDCFPAKDKN